MEPVQFLARLASLIPPPRHPFVRYFGVLSSASRWREHVGPNPDETEPDQPQRSKPRGKTIDAEDTLAGAGTSAKQAEPAPALHGGCVAAATNYVDLATLLRRVFDVDSLQCPRCGGRLRFIATISEQLSFLQIPPSVHLGSAWRRPRPIP